MSEFLDYFRGEQIDWAKGRPIWNTLAPLRYRDDETLIVPAEFRTDLASVPRLPLFWWIAGGRGIRPATFHDFAYQFGFWWIEGRDGWSRRDVDRATADRLFYESLLADPLSGAGGVIAWQMYQAVRLGGRGVWQSGRAPSLNPIWSGGGWETP